MVIFCHLPVSFDQSVSSPLTSLINNMFLPADLLLTGIFFLYFAPFSTNSRAVVLNPGSGEPQGVLAFVVTQQLIDQLKQLITQLTHLTWFLGLNWLLILG